MIKSLLRGAATLALIASTFAYAGTTYLVCGSDEDGCDLKHPNAGCMCFPYNDVTANQPYCLHFGASITCKPRPANATKCPGGDWQAKSQASCLALAYQSEENPPCYHFSSGRAITRQMCDQHHVVKCHADGSC